MKKNLVDGVIAFVLVLFALIVLALVFSSCGGPGQLTGTGYLVTIEKGIMMKWDRLETAAQADSFIYQKAGLTVKTDSLIGTDRLYFDMKNGDGWYVYVEQQGIYQRRPGGKKRWRVYDEELEISNNEYSITK